MTPFVTLRACCRPTLFGEKITQGERWRFFVRVAEQGYVVQNPTGKPPVFIVRHHAPENWTVDSDRNPPAGMTRQLCFG